MPKISRPVFPQAGRQALALGQRLREARLRRRMPAVTMAGRAGISRATLHRLEKGDVSISLGALQRILQVLGLGADIDLLARDDVLGRKLQDMALPGPRPRRGTRAMDDG
ncbi:MAG TPA: helix-turn-helix transcriptional regulator [Rhodanobacteraceae bacterium]|nr:helix-turn-helix transcriptional regulator [Rhodanobacteraceae bacterium]